MNAHVARLALSAFFIMLLAGCGDGGAPAAPKTEVKPADAGKTAVAAKSDHGVWCEEHGVPEAVCAKCDPKLEEQFKKSGDWCKDHGEPKSQCLKCDPALKAKFEAMKVELLKAEPKK